MMYQFYLAGVLLPIAPQSLEVNINDKDTEIDLANGGTMSILNQPGLSTYSFTFRAPNVKYPFALYQKGYLEAPAFLSLLSRLKTSQKPFQFQVIRGNTYVDYRDINTVVSLVSYDITEDAENGMDFMISVKLKEYVKYQTHKDVQANISLGSNNSGLITVDTYVDRDIDLVISESYYTTIVGDTFHKIAQKYFGSTNYAEAIATHNNIEFTLGELKEGTILNLNSAAIRQITEARDREKYEQQKQELEESWDNLRNSVINGANSVTTAIGNITDFIDNTKKDSKWILDGLSKIWGVLFG